MIIEGKGFDLASFSQPFWQKRVQGLIDADEQLTLLQRDRLRAGLQEPQVFGTAPALEFLLFQVFHRSQDHYARACADRLATSVIKFGEMREYLEGRTTILSPAIEDSLSRLASISSVGAEQCAKKEPLPMSAGQNVSPAVAATATAQAAAATTGAAGFFLAARLALTGMIR